MEKIKSLHNLFDLHKAIINIKGTNNVPIIVVGNKIDLIKDKSFLSEQAHLVAVESFNCPYIESSAKYDVNVKKIFSKTIDLILSFNEEDNMDASARRNSSISIVRRLSLINGNQKISRRFSLPAVAQQNKSSFLNKNKKSSSNGKNSAKESGKNTPNSRKKQKNCSIS